jgi:hypothetical protein
MYCRQRRHLYYGAWSNLEILFAPLLRSSPFIGGLHCQAIQTEHGPYIAERTQKAVHIVRCLCCHLTYHLNPILHGIPGLTLQEKGSDVEIVSQTQGHGEANTEPGSNLPRRPMLKGTVSRDF